jgi:hypothetical protein
MRHSVIDGQACGCQGTSRQAVGKIRFVDFLDGRSMVPDALDDGQWVSTIAMMVSCTMHDRQWMSPIDGVIGGCPR